MITITISKSVGLRRAEKPGEHANLSEVSQCGIITAATLRKCSERELAIAHGAGPAELEINRHELELEGRARVIDAIPWAC
jgi:hypothetical protein